MPRFTAGHFYLSRKYTEHEAQSVPWAIRQLFEINSDLVRYRDCDGEAICKLSTFRSWARKEVPQPASFATWRLPIIERVEMKRIFASMTAEKREVFMADYRAGKILRPHRFGA